MTTKLIEELKLYDQKDHGGNGDNKIDSHDQVFEELMVWFDYNGNQVTDPGELVSLASTGVRAIDLRYVAIKRIDRFGNEILGYSRARMEDGTLKSVYDMWFALPQ